MVVEFIFDIMVRLILTHKSYLVSVEEVEEFKEIITVTTSELLGAFNLGDYIPFLRWLDLQGCERAMKKLNRRRDKFLQRAIDNSRLCIKEENDESLIDVLIHLMDKAEDFFSDEAIVKATAISIIIGATDTYATTTEWAMATLLQRPEVLKRAQEELDVVVGSERVLEESDLPNLKYLEAIVKETLRLYPAGPLLLPHMAAAPCTVGGYYVPAGTELLLNAWGIHRDPAVWERPLEFEPERFLNSSSPDLNGHDFKYIPFGYGRRACPGMWVALRMLLLTVGRLLQSFDWSIPDGIEGVDMNEGRALTLHKAVPLEAAIKPRLPQHLY
jgi:cytochrome P450